ncbi:MAG: acyl-CoA thioesterase [Bacteroidetes bacterium]|nr:acyl-CoA thioesterase [Bacteroidota bacterium]MCW5895783.1 acyl-CoA thioesterase [Bacteroidota bacterium]
MNLMPYTRFESELIVRPDDIDMNNHVHNSKYLDYVLAARYDQMGRCYGMPMDEFLKNGWNWYQKAFFIEFKRAVTLADRVIVQTWLDSFDKADVKVGFQIFKKEPRKVAAEGYFISTMIDMKTGRALIIPQEIIEHYTQYTG